MGNLAVKKVKQKKQGGHKIVGLSFNIVRLSFYIVGLSFNIVGLSFNIVRLSFNIDGLSLYNCPNKQDVFVTSFN